MKLPVKEVTNREGQIITGNPLYDELIRLSMSLEDALTDLTDAGQAFAHADDVYRRAKAKAIVGASGKGKNAEERASIADPLFADQRLAANIAEASKEAALERSRGRRAQLSAFQTLVSAMKSTGEAAEFGQLGLNERT